MTTQLDLYQLMPGVAGGRALRDERGATYYAGIAGGHVTAARYGREYMRELASRGGLASAARRNEPHTIQSESGELVEVLRRVCYWPPRSTKRRRRPVPVFIVVAILDRLTGEELP